MSREVKTFVFILAGIALVLTMGFVRMFQMKHANPPTSTNQRAQAVAANAIAQSPVTNAMKSPSAAGIPANYPDFKMRPLPVDIESTNNQWAVADGKDTNVIRQLAHNPLEYARMVDENARIFQRQLVYLKETAASVFERAKLTGAPVTQLTLPVLDGRELTFEIAKREGGGSSRQGMFSGHLVGNTDSLVTMAFEDGREAFTILSPKENVFVVAEPRENGKVIVKAIDPNTYGVGPAPGDADDVVKSPSIKK
jgi:hypothetical protein